MENTHFNLREKGLKGTILIWFLAVGIAFTLTGLLANFIVMGKTFGFISLFAFITNHWSFWVFLVGVAITISVYCVYKIDLGKNNK